MTVRHISHEDVILLDDHTVKLAYYLWLLSTGARLRTHELVEQS